jgi:predicted DNA-binding transcriptional regulator AlpA
METLKNTRQAAEHVGMRLAEFRYLMQVGRGPRFTKLGRTATRFTVADLDAWKLEHDKELTAAQCAAWLGFSKRWLEQLAQMGKGPKRQRRGRRVYYMLEDVQTWLMRMRGEVPRARATGYRSAAIGR